MLNIYVDQRKILLIEKKRKKKKKKYHKKERKTIIRFLLSQIHRVSVLVSPVRLFSDHDEPGGKSWTDMTQHAVKSLNVPNPSALKSDDRSSSVKGVGKPEDPSPSLLNSAADSAKLIVPWEVTFNPSLTKKYYKELKDLSRYEDDKIPAQFVKTKKFRRLIEIKSWR